jgi:HEAT repeat protein
MISLFVLLAAAAASQGHAYRPAREAAPARAAVTAPDETLSDEAVRALASSYLGRIDVPVTAAEWRALGPRAVPLLEEVARSRGALPSRRAAAMGGLAAIGGARAGEILVEAARSESEPFAVRAAAIHGASRALDSRRLARELGPVLERAKDPAARVAAAEALALRAPRSACAAVRAQADREGEGRARFERALGRCGSKR